MTIARWLWNVVVCPECGARLRPGRDVCRCDRCGPYPVVGGVPLLVPSPVDYCASFRESVLAALAECDLATAEAVRVVQVFADAGKGEAQRFGDDWTVEESRGEAPPSLVAGPAAEALAALEAAARDRGPAAWLGARLGSVKVAVELGCGAGARSEQLAHSTRQLVVGDLSLRAVLRARARAFRGKADVAGVVLDANALPLARGRVDLLVAENLADLLDEPDRFFDAMGAALSKRGRALVTSPEPTLGSGDERMADRLARGAGLQVCAMEDGLPWLRVNSRRHLEVYVVRALELRRRARAR